MNIVAVIVSYHPDLEALKALLDGIKSQVNAVVVVDNGSAVKLKNWLDQYQAQAIHGIFLGANTGVAAAQNVGIGWAREQGADYVVLFDQDSRPGPDMVRRLVEAVQAKQSMGCKVAAAGPRFTDERQGNPPPFIRVTGLKLIRLGCDETNPIVEVDYLISSGCLIPMSTLDVVGLMREELFIDYVDIEWGLRARHHGFQSLGVCSALMQHSLGDHPIELFGKKIPVHSPLRHYYHFRNAVLLYREAWVPLNLKLVDGWRLWLKYVFYSLFAKPRTAHWRMMTLGVWHGLMGKSGKLDGGAA
jgi:rhamnosyltransferase